MSLILPLALTELPFAPEFRLAGDVGVINSVQVLPSGKILVMGSFDTVSGFNYTNIVKLHPTGKVDTTFPLLEFDGVINGSAIRSDGLIYIVGAFTHIGANTRPNAVLYDEYGVEDATFRRSSSYINAEIEGCVVDNYDRLVIWGGFTYVYGVTRHRIARLTTTCAVDAGFSVPTPSSVIFSVVVNSDDTLFIGGAFATIGATSIAHLAKLLNTGAVDTGFSDIIINAPILKITPILGGVNPGLILSGIFDTVQGYTRKNICRISLTGVLDTAFDANVTVRAIYPNHTLSADENTVLLLTSDGVTIGGQSYANVLSLSSSTGSVTGGFDAPTLHYQGTDSTYYILGDSYNADNYLIYGYFDSVNGKRRASIVKISAITGKITK